MYRNAIVPSQGLEADQVYVQKIRNSLAEMGLVKETAIRTENYILADQTRTKMLALQTQLTKMEHQFNADIITGYIASWQTDLAETVASMLNSLATGGQSISTFRKSIVNMTFPLKHPAHLALVKVAELMPQNYYDSLIKAMLIHLPHEAPDIPRTHFGWETFIRKVPQLQRQSAEVVEAVKSSLILSTLDVLMRVTGQLNMSNLKRDTHTLFLKHTFHYVRTSASKRVSMDFEARLFEQIGVRWSVIIGDLANVDRTEIIRNISSLFDPMRKPAAAPEDIIMILSATRYISSARPKSEKEAQEVVALMHELLGCFERHKKSVIRLAIVQALERLVQPLDFTMGPTPSIMWENAVHTEMMDLFKYARKWAATSEDLRAAATRLCIIILTNTSVEFFGTNIDAILTDLLPATVTTKTPPVKPYVFDCILQLLRGRWYVDTLLHARLRVLGKFNPKESFGHLTRPVSNESVDIITNRARDIADKLFVRRKPNSLPLSPEIIEVCVEMVCQMSSHALSVGLKLIAFLLSGAKNVAEGVTAAPDTSPEYLYIGMRSLRTLLDVDSGFTTHAVCAKLDPQFPVLLNEIPYEFETYLISTLHYCDHHAGVAVFGRSGVVLEPILEKHMLPEEEEKIEIQDGRIVITGGANGPGSGLQRGATLMRSRSVSSVTRPKDIYARGDDDVLAMISDALESTTLNGSVVGTADGRAPTAQSMASLAHPGAAATTAALHEEDKGPGVLGLGLAEKIVVEMNAKVVDSVKSWYAATKSPSSELPSIAPPNSEKLKFSSTLRDPVRIKRSAAVGMVPGDDLMGMSSKMKPEVALVLRLFREVLRMVQFIPHPELVSGQLFVGACLIHSKQEIAHEASFALQTIFRKFPEMRMSIINGFLNYIKNTPHNDDISYCTVLTQLSVLLRYWVKIDTPLATNPEQFKPEEDVLNRVSCKLDACMLVMLARPNARIRHTALSALSDMFTLAELVKASGPNAGKSVTQLPLHLIIRRASSTITRHAILAYMQRDLLGSALAPSRLASILSTSPLRNLTFSDVALSEYSVLFKYYLGELARQFVYLGRVKAIRHGAKFLRQLAVPYMTSVNAVDTEFVNTYASYSILLFSLGGVPLKSEDGYSMDAHSSPDRILFGTFRNFLAPILKSDNQWEVKAIVTSCYFTQKPLLQLFVLQLWQWYAEFLQTTAQPQAFRMVDNTVYAFRTVCQSPEFALTVREPAVFQTSMVDVISDMLRLAEAVLTEKGTGSTTSFLVIGPSTPIVRVKMAVNLCVIVDRLSAAITVGRSIILKEREAAITAAAVAAAIEGSQPVRPSLMFDSEPTGLVWDAAPRRSLIYRFKDWFSVVGDALATNVTPTSKVAAIRVKLAKQIGVAAASLLGLGDMFEGVPIQPDVLSFMANLQGYGCKVFSPTLLYNYENALGTVLAHSYSSKGSAAAFTDAIFEQVIPRFVEQPELFLQSDNVLTTENEDYLCILQSLPISNVDNSVEKGTLIFPVIDNEAADKLRQNLGSLIFFGLYNMMSSDKIIRNRAFQFVRELFCMYNPDPALDMVALLKKYTGTFYSNISLNLKDRILELSRLASDFYAGDAPSFLWEAVRCSRSVQKADKPQCLMASQQWILELIMPWCRYVNLSNMEEDIVFAEFFRYLMDAAFYRPKHSEQVQVCWSEVASAPEWGPANSEMFAEVLVQICGKFERLREQALALLSRVFLIHPVEVAGKVAVCLSSGAFPWRMAAGADGSRTKSVLKPSKPIITEYITVLYTALNGGTPDAINEYSTSCKASVILTSEMVLQNFGVLTPHLSTLLNYVMLHLPECLQDSSVSTYLLTNIVEGKVSMMHQLNTINAPESMLVVAKLKMLMLQLENAGCFVEWPGDDSSKKVPDQRVIRTPVEDFLATLISTFEKDVPSLSLELIQESLLWANDNVLGPDISVRAIEMYTALIEITPQVPVSFLNAMSTRLREQVALLGSLEAETMMAADPSSGRNGWDRLSESKQVVKRNSEAVILALLRLSAALIRIYSKLGKLSEHSSLFWSSACLLHLPCGVFDKITTLALENCLMYLTPHERNALKPLNTAFFNGFYRLRENMDGLQVLLLQGIFEKKHAKVQGLSLTMLLQCWNSLPDEAMDRSPVGLLYAILYSLTFVFSKIMTADPGAQVDATVFQVTALLQELLSQKNAIEFAGIIKSLQTITSGLEALTSEVCEDMLERCAANVSQVYFPDCTNNVSEYCAFMLQTGGTGEVRVALKMTQVMWSLANRNQSAGGFKALIKRLAYTKVDSGNVKHVNELLAFVMTEVADLDEFIKEIDLTSSGRVDTLPEFDRPSGSVSRAMQGLTLLF